MNKMISLGRCPDKHFHTSLLPTLILVPHTGHLQLQCRLNNRYKNVGEDMRLCEIINQS